MKTLTSRADEPVDLVLWRNGRQSAADVEAAFDNTRGLADKPIALPARAAIHIPEAPATPIIKTVKLWD